MSRYRCPIADGTLDATVTIPGSKSISNRAAVIAALADGHSLLTNFLAAEDTRLMLEALGELGVRATFDEPGRAVEVTGCGGLVPADEAQLHCGNAGTVMRFGLALTALGYGRFQFDGVPRMRQRPVGPLTQALQSLGAGIEFTGREGYPPVIVHAGGLRGGQVRFDSPESSQMISALLMVSPYAGGDVMIEAVGKVPSTPYLKMTTRMMEQFGVAVIERYDTEAARFVVEASQRYRGGIYAIEPDASNASYFLAAPAVAGGRVTVSGLGTNSIQGDVRFVDLLERMGCTVAREPNRLTVTGPPEPNRLVGIDADLNDMPDTAPTLAVTALFADGPTTIRNVPNLRVKETDRLAAIARELCKIGARVDETADGLKILPPTRLDPAVINTYDDHRMAMSFAVAGLKCPGLIIDNPQCCAKTFPDFFTHWERMLDR